MKKLSCPNSQWSQLLKDDFEANNDKGIVGTLLVSETERVRVWSLTLKPGERINFHRHVLDYFWTVLTKGKARSHFGDGTMKETAYNEGDTSHLSFKKDAFMVHDLENIGDTTLIFTTVEFLDSENSPLPVPEHHRKS